MAVKTDKKSANSTGYKPRLLELYQNDLRAKLKQELKLDNIYQVPELEKIVVNIGLGKAQGDKRMFEVAENTLRKITGQQPVTNKAKVSIASFKLREGSNIGMMVTLRGDRMYEFFDRVVNIVIPRLRDFHGLAIKSFDNSGNFSIGFKDQSVFPELSYEETAVAHGLQITMVTNSTDIDSNVALFRGLGLPLEKETTKEDKMEDN